MWLFLKAQLKGRAELTTITAASSVTSSIHQDAVTTHPRQSKCPWCGYSHPKGNCPASGQQCFNCSGIGHYTALCKKPRTSRFKCSQSRDRPRRSTTAGTTANHLTEADHTGAQAEAPHAGSKGHLITTAGTGEAPHHAYIRLATFHSQLQNIIKQKAN